MPSPTLKTNTRTQMNSNTDTTSSVSVSSPTFAPSSTSNQPSKSIFDKISSRISTSGNNNQHSNSSQDGNNSIKRGLSMRFSKAIGSKVLFRPNDSDFSSLSKVDQPLVEFESSRAQKTRSVSIMVPNYDLAEKQGISRQAILESERVTNFKLQMKKRKQKGRTSFAHLITKRTISTRGRNNSDDSDLVECK
ncbi:hypothetical protein FDP41_013189 [Naegleria fowleri]|uniref:Uncharacterized protein n=1 Tax=Naegleria fowleri TaxID=5763 RepID=A0A6A5BZ75_NAEFO|nr:uncharacterized protein FDP41_013189 [Naegleria fowleri]KAF0980706.1 hypothetical protein FDP41_013189 [Naegleria fowleri]CAG4711120.1 unnamed protein product [Naegleria fowleri]